MTDLAVLILLLYVVFLFVLSRGRADAPPAAEGDGDLFFVFVIACLNEELVIGPTLERLLAIPSEDFAVLVVDDGSTDGTADVVGAYASRRIWMIGSVFAVDNSGSGRVWLLRRVSPDGKRGKGDALNAAYRYLTQSNALAGRSADSVIVAVFDADGRLDPGALTAVSPYFCDPHTGAVQVAVDMRNASAGLLPRLQDVEFTVFTEIFQRARRRLGSVGLGGNGQFVRLSALLSLRRAPWTDCLTEDLDLGIRLLLAGWANRYCPSTSVSQQAVTEVRRWLGQRSRWFQGHLQCWRLIAPIIRSPLPGRSASDLIWYLMLPAAILLTPLMVFPVVFGLAALAVAMPGLAFHLLTASHGLVAGLLYAFVFGPAYVYGYVYWRRGKAGLLASLALAHLFELYAHLWVAAGWIALARISAGRHGWMKTTRFAEPAIAQQR